ncbi:MAG: ABC-2 family transporter protein [Bdellovibrionia bacterium]
MHRRKFNPSKYFEFFTIAVRQGLVHRGNVFIRFGFYGVILLVFSRLWVAAFEQSPVEGSSPADMLWYLAITEWIVLSTPLIHLTIEEDVRNGNLAYRLIRPVSYVWSKVFEGLGTLLLNYLILGCAGFIFAWLLSGELPSHPEGFWFLVPLGILAGFVSLIFHTIIGLTAFWLQDASPIAWVWQKCAFVFGGLILPVSLYPGWLQKISVLTPFSSLLYGPAKAALTADLQLALNTAGLLVCWATGGVLLLLFIYSRGLRILDVNGG